MFKKRYYSLDSSEQKWKRQGETATTTTTTTRKDDRLRIRGLCAWWV